MAPTRKKPRSIKKSKSKLRSESPEHYQVRLLTPKRYKTQLTDVIVRLRREYSGDKDAEKIITNFEGLFSQDNLENSMNRIQDVYKDLGHFLARSPKPTAQKY